MACIVQIDSPKLATKALDELGTHLKSQDTHDPELDDPGTGVPVVGAKKKEEGR